jgi:N-acetylmuramoyl-L-alanine amidase/Mannosyl-glycoprotein endo-beta-N-acetylglucosaminidase
MGRIFVCAAYGGYQGVANELDGSRSGTNEARSVISLRGYLAPELFTRGFEVIEVPDATSFRQSIDWIEQRAKAGDIAVAIGMDAYAQSQTQGVTAYYTAKNIERKNHAQMLLLAFSSRLPDVPNRGAKPDTVVGTGSLTFCRRLSIPSIVMEIGLKADPEDREAGQALNREVVLGVADGLVAWSRDVSMQSKEGGLPQPISLKIDREELSPEKGLLIDGDPYVPIDLADRLGVNLPLTLPIRRVRYRGIVYVKAIELRDFNISIVPDIGFARSFLIKSEHSFSGDNFDRIIGRGHATVEQLEEFLRTNNEEISPQFNDICRLYVDECKVEGVNHDIAFAQMCLETRFLNFPPAIDPGFYNLASLGDKQAEWATFASLRLGVRAHVQQLKAYGSIDPLVQECVAPRFDKIKRGIAPSVRQLLGRWSIDAQYPLKIAAILRQLYEKAGLF